MKWTYNTGIFLYTLIIRIFALFNTKARKFIEGRANVFNEIAANISGNDQHIWFHFASLGEFEQGRPVMEQLKKHQPEKQIIVTFFSPSGYEIRRHYALAKGVYYLPMDTAANAKRFVSLIKPEMVVFTKYEFWFHYFQTIHKNGIPLYLISGIFRPQQTFFKWYGGFYRRMLTCITYFFVQNEESAALLRSINLTNVSVSGDTRFDRVAENAENPTHLPVIEDFYGAVPVLICGSTWPDDEKIIAVLAGKFPEWKFIIAPHEIDAAHIQQISGLFPQAVRHSELKNTTGITHTGDQALNKNILIIDNIGMLSGLYQYGTIAYIGGGFGTGIHNTLEAAAFGLPVIFGPEYAKFQEAKDLIALGGAKSISSADELIKAFEAFINDKNASAIAKKYVNDKKGATVDILQVIAPA